MHPDDLPRVERRLQEHLAGHSAHYECEYRMARPDGRWSWILAHGQVMRHGDDGSPQRALGTHMDITTRKTADEERRARQIRLEKLTSQIPGVVYQLRLRPDGRIGLPYASPGMYTHYGVRPEQVAQDAGELFDLVHPDDRRRLVESLYQSSRDMKVWETEWRMRRTRRAVALGADPRQTGTGKRWQHAVERLHHRHHRAQTRGRTAQAAGHQRRTHRPQQPPQLLRAGQCRTGTGQALRRPAGGAGDAGSGPLQARQRRLRPRHGRPCAAPCQPPDPRRIAHRGYCSVARNLPSCWCRRRSVVRCNLPNACAPGWPAARSPPITPPSS
ncbi:PAS domain-containing protein [Paludibacterium sp. dN 18-1]|uniref:histidine kinase n=1 Tax=Paludibacterium denitrificans TaxID=2675226 RepID=A0A844GEN4_9NEIS|nr:PAS domain-containing protein [Paludibacterium denitrificans]